MRVGIKWTHILTLNVVRCISLFLTILKRYDTCMQVSYGIGNNIFNPIYEGGDKINSDINPKCS